MIVNSSRTFEDFFLFSLSFLLEQSMTSALPRHRDLHGRPIGSLHDLLAEFWN